MAIILIMKKFKIQLFLKKIEFKVVQRSIWFLFGLFLLTFGFFLINKWEREGEIFTKTLLQKSDSNILVIDGERKPNEEVNKIVVDIGGSVNFPGVYLLAEGSRLSDLVREAGGFRIMGNRLNSWVQKYLNLAESLIDGAKYYIPYEEELLLGGFEVSSNALLVENGDFEPNSDLVSINQASLSELDDLPGIGESRAQDIIDNRPYSSLEDFRDREVVSEGVFSEIEILISL